MVKAGILIPTFNRRKFFEVSLRSALAQTHTGIEIIAVDDGSSDGTAEYGRSVGDPRFTFVENEANLGMPGNVNRGMSMFGTEVGWCTVLGDDDWLEPEFVSSCLAEAARNPGAVILDGSRVIVDPKGRRLRRARRPRGDVTALQFLESRLRKRRDSFLTGLLFRRDAFLAIGGYPMFATGLAADDAFIFHLALRDRLVTVNSAPAFVRFHSEAESHLPGDLRVLLGVMDQFVDYCRTAGTASGRISGRDEEHLFRTLDACRAAVNSGNWLRHLHAALALDRGRDRLLKSLYSVGVDPEFAFTRRVRFDAWLHGTLGLSPEKFLPYRAFWHLPGLRSPNPCSRWVRNT
ncbi:MAG: glycosyltransferase family 2 protein [Deltaproteobacteria bacterium]|nr:MAG: glycosyltransferase family 2 protein [Deltaproteobacteria bacterium]